MALPVSVVRSSCRSAARMVVMVALVGMLWYGRKLLSKPCGITGEKDFTGRRTAIVVREAENMGRAGRTRCWQYRRVPS